MDKTYYEINLDSRRENTFEEDEAMGLFSGVMGALIADCSPLTRAKLLKRSLHSSERPIRLSTAKHSSKKS